MRSPLLHLTAVLALALLGFFVAPATPAQAQTPPAHYDTDGDGLIEISNLAQFNAVRWDLDGNGTPSSGNATNYNAAFPVASGGSVCPSGTTCTGYELVANLDFDENGDGEITESGDPTYWNGGSGWEPINASRFEFEGNGHTIANLFIYRGERNIGLFGQARSEIRNVGLVNVNVTGLNHVGALAGAISGSREITGNYATGSVAGRHIVGGLVGLHSSGSISQSYASTTVTGGAETGGLVGNVLSGSVRASYATGRVRTDQGVDQRFITNENVDDFPPNGRDVGGLVGRLQSSGNTAARVTSSYSSSTVNNSVLPASTAGLIAWINSNLAMVENSYYDTDEAPGYNAVRLDPNFGINATVTNVSGKTTAELQSPTGNTGIYSAWDATVWDFGTSSQYPVLKVDFNGDGTATWQEFGFQRPPWVTGVTATGGQRSLDVSWDVYSPSHVDGYLVQWKQSVAPSYADADVLVVSSGSTTRATISGLPADTSYDVRVIATSRSHGIDEASAPATATTLPPYATVSATDPSPLTESNLDGATVTVDLIIYDRWARQPMTAGQVTASGVPGVRVVHVVRESDERATVTLAYDGGDEAYDFDTDATLRLDFNGAHTSIGTITAVVPVTAVVEAPPSQVQNVRATPGTQRVQVKWDAVPTASENLDRNRYRVQWKERASDGGWRELKRARGSLTSYTIPGLDPGTEYAVRVIATRHKAPDGPPSAEARATTPAFEYRLAGTEPAQLTGANLNGATITVALQGAEWELAVAGRQHRVVLSGLETGVWVDRLEHVSPSELRFVLGHRGPWITEDGDLRLLIRADLHGWTENVVVTAPVKAPVQAGGLRVVEVTDNTVTVAWDEVEGNDVYYRVRWKESASDGGWRARWTRGPDAPGRHPFYQIRDLEPGTEYTAQVRSWDRDGAGYGRWSSATMTTTGGEFETSPQQRAGVTISAANPVAIVEGGGDASYKVVLDGQPTGNVTITMSSDNGDVSTQPSSLTFTPNNWQTAQTVTVRASQDDDAADDTATVSHEVSGGNYDGIAVASVAVSVADDDEAGVTVSESSVSLTEGGSATYTVSLTAQPLSDVEIYVLAHGVSVHPASLMFTPGNWRTAQTVTVSAGQDDDTSDETGVITHGLVVAAGSGYESATLPGDVTVSVSDDDEAQQQEPEPVSVTVSATNLPIREGGASTYTVALDVEPTENVTITVSSNNGDVTTQPSSLTFTTSDWQTAQTVTVSAGQDEDSDDETATVSHAVSGVNYDGVTVASVAVSVTDDDDAQAVEEPAADPNRVALEALYNATGGASWTNSANWLSDKPLNQWHGVTTNGSGQVTHLSLRDNNLSGSLPAALGNLTHLQVLSLDRNNLSGSIPTQLGNLSNLTRLAMNRNQLSGAIPSQLGSLSNLSIIGLARNQLSGSLPASLGNLSGLTKVSLHDNTALSGALPSGFTGMGGLQRLAIANTGICIPSGDAFRDWLDTVPDKPGIDGLATCQ